jgi:hypothetical protein
MKLLLISFALLCLLFISCTLLWLLHTPPAELYTSPEKAQALTLDQLFWLRSKPSLDDEEYLVMERGWKFEKQEILNDSTFSTYWTFQDTHKKRLAEVIYESRGHNNFASLTYSTSNRATFNAIQAKVTAYHMKYVGRRKDKGAEWSYFRYGDYDVGMAVYANPKAAHPTWYTIFVRPTFMRPYRGTLKWN